MNFTYGTVAACAAALALVVPAPTQAAEQRAYEQVSDNAGNATQIFTPLLSRDGDHAVWGTFNHPVPNANSGGEMFLASRTASGWRAEPVPNAASRYTGVVHRVADDGSRWVTSDLADDGLTPAGLHVRSAGGGDRRIGPANTALDVVDATPDLGAILLRSQTSLDPAKPHPGVAGLYLDDGSGLRLVSVDAAGAPIACGSDVSGGRVSPDGRRVLFFAATGAPGCAGTPQLWLYDTATGTSTQVSVNAQTTTAALPAIVGGDRSFATVYLRTASRLEAADANGTADVYRYVAATDTWTRLSKFADGDDAAVSAAAASPDGSHVYFVAGKALGGNGTANASNLYAWSAADGLRYVATSTTAVQELDAPAGDWRPPISADGTVLLFSSAAITAPAPAVYSGPRAVFRYDAAARTLTCASCAPGVTPTGDATPSGDTLDWMTDRQMTRDGGLVAFVTSTPLVPADTNGTLDAYLWDHGTLRLVSPGDYAPGVASRVVSLSADGRDYLFATTQLLAGPGVGDVKLFDARIGGGFSVAEAPPPCAGDACQGPASPVPSFGASATATFSGPGNVTPGAPPVPVAPSVALGKVSAAQRAALARTGRLALRAVVRGGGTVTGRITATVGGRTRTVAQASRTVRGTGATTVTLSLRLSAAARRGLSQRRRLKVKVSVGVTGAATRSVSFTLKRARR